ncbi:MAG: hypothetical protein KFB95_02250 [Simkaniaceae bacterium]|nr:MAG: hypothetical protein KFB95_02250 [Simkaniaceae bacterium]
MAEITVSGQPLKFWTTDNINQVSQKKMGRDAEAPTFREIFVEFVTDAYQQEGVILGLERDNKELSEHSREFAGRVEILTFDVQIRNEILDVQPVELADYIVRLGQELGEFEATDVPEEEADARERQARIDKLIAKLEVAQGYQKVVGPFVQELTETAAAVKMGAEELERAQKQFEEDAQLLRDRIVGLERDGLPAHTDEIQRLTLVLREKTEAFDALGIEHQALVTSAREAEELLSTEVESLRGLVAKAREAQGVAEEALNEQRRANDALKVEHVQVLREAGEAANARAEELQRQLDQLREENVQLAERVRVFEEAPEADVQLKAEMLGRVAVAVLGVDPDIGLLEARVGEHMQAEGRLGQLYALAHIPRDGGAFDALVGMIQSVARIFTTWGRGDAQSLAAYAAHFEPNVAEINRKAGDYDRVELERADAVRDLGQAQLDLVRERADSKKLLSILGNGFSWTWSTTTAVPRFIYDAMRF